MIWCCELLGRCSILLRGCDPRNLGESLIPVAVPLALLFQSEWKRVRMDNLRLMLERKKKTILYIKIEKVGS